MHADPVEEAAEPGSAAAEPGLVPSTLALLRLLVGWSCVALGALNLAMGAAGTRYLVFHLMLVVGGALLVGWGGPAPRRRWVALAVGGLVTVLGTVLSALPATSACCLRGYDHRHGFPFALLGRGTGGWHLSPGYAAVDLLFWALAGLLVAAAVPPARAGRTSTGPTPPVTAADRPAPTTHAEHRATPTPAPDDQNVGGLP